MQVDESAGGASGGRSQYVSKDEPKVLWEDENIAVMLKGPGWIVAISRDEEHTKGLVALLKRKGTSEARGLVESGEPEHFCHYLMLKYSDDSGHFLSRSIENQFGIAHRLDVDTSGALMVGKTEAGFSHLRRAFISHEVFKEYVCLVHGAVKQDHGEVNFPITWDESTNQSYISEHGQWAKSMYTVLGRYRLRRGKKIFSLCRVVIVTGRTHQIRLHMASLGHPLVGDNKYNRKNLSTDLMWCPRLFLHAWRLRFMDVGRVVREVKAPLTKDLTMSLRTLEEVYLDLTKDDNPSLRTTKPLEHGQTSMVKDPPPAEAGPSTAAAGRPQPPCATDAGDRRSPWRPPLQPGGPLGDDAALEKARALVSVPAAPRSEEHRPCVADGGAPLPRQSARPTVVGGVAKPAPSVSGDPQEESFKDAPEAQVDALVGMGFDRSRAAQALEASDNNLFEALDALAAEPACVDDGPKPTKQASLGADESAIGGTEEDLQKVLEWSQREAEERQQREEARKAEEAANLQRSIAASKLEVDLESEAVQKALLESEQLASEQRRRQELEEEELERALRESIREYEAFFSSVEGYDLEEILRQSVLEAHGHSAQASTSSTGAASRSPGPPPSASAGGGVDEERLALRLQASYNDRGDFDDEDEVVLFGHQGSALTPFERDVASKASNATCASRWLAEATAALHVGMALAPKASAQRLSADAPPFYPPGMAPPEAPAAVEADAAALAPADGFAGGGQRPGDAKPALTPGAPAVLGGRRGRWATRAKS